MIDDPPVDELEQRRRKRAQETPVGGVGDAWKNFEPGQQVLCRVVAPEEGGYSVVLVEGHTPGYLPTERKHKHGEDVRAQFVCVNGGRLLLVPLLRNLADSPDLSNSSDFD